MILRLEIKNYAIIDTLSIPFSKHLNIITGETGSGKSILLGALGMILGKRADSKSLLNQDKKCIIECEFDISAYQLQDFFEQEDLDYEDHVIIRREILPSGKSRAFINDTPASLKQLQSLASQLVDLHQQFENLGINDPNQQLNMLDAIAENSALIQQYQAKFKDFRTLKIKKRSLEDQLQNSIKQRDYLQFQLDELVEMDLNLDQDLILEQDLKIMEHSEEIVSALGLISNAIESEDHSVLDILQSVLQQIGHVKDYHQGVNSLLERIDSSILELEDIAREASSLADDTEYDPQQVLEMKSRMDKINQLLYKHQLQEVKDLIEFQEELESQVENFDHLEEAIIETEKSIKEVTEILEKLAAELSSRRKKAAPSFEKNVNELLKNLKMEHATFKVQIEAGTDLQVHGKDHMEFLIAPNKGSKFASIKSVASGGEVSRLSLITKSLVAKEMHMPTLIFDEIDSGVSGDVAAQMGRMLDSLASDHQVISITHSPQVAAKAHTHFNVYKTIDGNSTKAKVRQLDTEERIIEIATMLSSSPPSNAALKSAKELMGI